MSECARAPGPKAASTRALEGRRLCMGSSTGRTASSSVPLPTWPNAHLTVEQTHTLGVVMQNELGQQTSHRVQAC